MSEEPRYRVVLESFDAGRELELVVLLSKLSGKPFDQIRPHLGNLPWKLASSMPESKARKLASQLEKEGAVVRLEQVEGQSGGSGAAGRQPPAAGGGGFRPPAPLGLGRRLRWALRIAFGTKLTQIGLILITGLASLIGSLATGLLTGGAMLSVMPAMGEGGTPPDPAAMLQAMTSPGFLAAIAIQLVVMMLIWGLYQAALLRLAPEYFRQGGRPPFGRLLRGAFARVPDLLSTAAIVFLPLAALPLLALMFVDPDAPERTALAVGGGFLVSMVLTFALFLVMPVAANEPVGPVRALVRGWRLASGYRWRFLGHVIVLLLLMLGVMMLATLGVGAVASLAAQVDLVLAAIVGPLAYFAEVLLLLFMATAFPVLATLFYLEARARHEGACFDWREVPADDWPTCDVGDEPPGRGIRAWGELLLVNGAILGLIYLATPLVEQRLGELAVQFQALMPDQPASSKAGQGRHEQSTVVPGLDVEQGSGTGARTLTLPTGPRFGDGTLSIRRDLFFSDEKDPRLWVRLRADGLFPGMKPGAIPGKAVQVRIREARARNGRNLYNAASRFERNTFFHELQWMHDGKSLTALRTVHLLPGVKQADDIVLIKGELVMEGSDIGRMTVPFALRDDQPVRFELEAGRIRPAGDRPPGSGQMSEAKTRSAPLPKDPNEAAYALYQQGRYRESIRMLDRIIADDPKNSWAWYTRAWAYWKLGDRDKAYADVAMACDLGYEEACSLKRQ